MGVDPYSFVSALNIVIAQRLLRANCKSCASPVSKEQVKLPRGVTIPAGATLMAGKGCGVCRGTGYKGRHAVAEVLCLDDEFA